MVHDEFALRRRDRRRGSMLEVDGCRSMGRGRRCSRNGKVMDRRAGAGERQSKCCRKPERRRSNDRTPAKDVAQLRIPHFFVSRRGNGLRGALDLVLAAERAQTRRALRDVLAIGAAFRIRRFAERDGAGETFDILVQQSLLYTRSSMTARSVFSARQTRWRTASGVVPRIAAASCDE